MKYIDCKWHKGDDLPTKDSMYITVKDEGMVVVVRWIPSMGWYCSDKVEFWSELPTKPTQKELDIEEYQKWLDTPGAFSWKETLLAFLAGCKSVRERMK